MTEIIAAMSNVTDFVGEVFTVMTSNPLLVVLLAASMLGVGINVFKELKGAVS